MNTNFKNLISKPLHMFDSFGKTWQRDYDVPKKEFVGDFCKGLKKLDRTKILINGKTIFSGLAYQIPKELKNRRVRFSTEIGDIRYLRVFDFLTDKVNVEGSDVFQKFSGSYGG